MKILVHRDDLGVDYTGGKLYVNGAYFCETMEDKDRTLEYGDGEKVYGQTCIPRGTYKCIIDFSGHFQRELPHLLDVPQFSGIRIHPGNDASASQGCILVGKTRKGGWVSDSRNTFAKLFELMDRAYDRGEDIEVEVT